MPWKERTVNKMRKEFVAEALSGKKRKSALCREYGISRPTGDKWIKRYLNGEDLTDRSHDPHTMPRNKTQPEMEAEIIALRKEYPAIGARKLRRMMQDKGVLNLPSTKTFNNILKRNGLITKEASEAATPYVRFEREAPNQLWQADFKGHFAVGDGTRCHPFNITDDHSRFSLCSYGVEEETLEVIVPIITEVFQEYGLPDEFLCDNGNPWGAVQRGGFTQFEVWFMDLDILTIHGRPIHPQTQGKQERFNGSLKREYLKYHQFSDMLHTQQGLDEYRHFYNHIRPHHALNLDTPARHYTASSRRFPAEIEPWNYSQEYQTYRVRGNGYIRFRGHDYFLSEAFAGRMIGIRESAISGLFTLAYRNFRVARIDPENKKFTLKKISRLQSIVSP